MSDNKMDLNKNGNTKIILPSIEPVLSAPSKRSEMKQKLFRIAFPFEHEHEHEHEHENEHEHEHEHEHENEHDDYSDIDGENEFQDNLMGTTSQVIHNDYLNNGNSLDIHTSFSQQTPFKISNNDNNDNNGQSSSNQFNSLHKFNKSSSSLSNSIASSINKLPYKAGFLNNSSTAMINKQGLNSRSNSIGNIPNSNDLNISHNYSPNKGNPRYLATSNNHTIVLPRNMNYQQTNLQPPSLSNQKQSISSSASITTSSNINHNSSSPQSPIVPKVITLPAFTSVNKSHKQSQSTSKILAPPTVLAPVITSNSTNSQGFSQTSADFISDSSHNNQSILTTNPPLSSGTPSILKQKKSRGLLQTACRSGHTTSPNPKNKNNSVLSINTSNNNQNEKNNTSKSLYPLEDDIRCIDSKLHLISPKIANQFQYLQKSIQLGIKKRLEYLDNENSEMLNNINDRYNELDRQHKQLIIQVNDLTEYLNNLNLKRGDDIKNLTQHCMFENLNDLDARIDNVKDNMNSNKKSIKQFEGRLDLLDVLKLKHQNRDKNRKHMICFVALMLTFILILKSLVFF